MNNAHKFILKTIKQAFPIKHAPTFHLKNSQYPSAHLFQILKSVSRNLVDCMIKLTANNR